MACVATTYGPLVSIFGAFVFYVARHVEVTCICLIALGMFQLIGLQYQDDLTSLQQYESSSTLLDLAWHWTLRYWSMPGMLHICVSHDIICTTSVQEKSWHIPIAATSTFLQFDYLSNCLLPCSMSPEFDSEIGIARWLSPTFLVARTNATLWWPQGFTMCLQLPITYCQLPISSAIVRLELWASNTVICHHFGSVAGDRYRPRPRTWERLVTDFPTVVLPLVTPIATYCALQYWWRCSEMLKYDHRDHAPLLLHFCHKHVDRNWAYDVSFNLAYWHPQYQSSPCYAGPTWCWHVKGISQLTIHRWFLSLQLCASYRQLLRVFNWALTFHLTLAPMLCIWIAFCVWVLFV